MKTGKQENIRIEFRKTFPLVASQLLAERQENKKT